MFFGNAQEKREEAQKEADALRFAASQICKVKKVVLAFDGKIYNCKFDKAIQELSENKTMFYCHSSYGWLYLECHTLQNKTITLLTTKAAEKEKEKDCFTEKKRIKAENMIDLLNSKYGECLKRATEIENSMQTLDQKLQQIAQLKKAINHIVSEIPSEVTNIYGMKYIY